MKSQPSKRASVWLGILFVALAGGAPAARPSGVILVHESRGETKFSRTDLVQIFRGERTYWSDRERILPILPPASNSASIKWLEDLVGLDQDELRREWEAKAFRGLVVVKPVQPRDIPALVRGLTQARHGIALLAESDVVGDLPPGVRLIRID